MSFINHCNTAPATSERRASGSSGGSDCGRLTPTLGSTDSTVCSSPHAESITQQVAGGSGSRSRRAARQPQTAVSRAHAQWVHQVKFSQKTAVNAATQSAAARFPLAPRQADIPRPSFLQAVPAPTTAVAPTPMVMAFAAMPSRVPQMPPHQMGWSHNPYGPVYYSPQQQQQA